VTETLTYYSMPGLVFFRMDYASTMLLFMYA